MLRIDDPLAAGVAPFYSTDFTSIIQKNYFDIFKGIYAGLRRNCREGLVIFGCEVTTNGSNIDIASGVVFLDGEFYLLDAQTNVAKPRYATPTTDVVVQRTFKDQTSQDFTVTKKATVQGTIPVGQYITFERTSAHKGWIRFTDFYSLANGWLESSTQPLEFRKNDDGSVSWRGTLVYNSATTTSDFFISNLVPASVADDLIPGDENPAGGLGASWAGISIINAGAFSGLQQTQAVGSFDSGIFAIGVPGIVAGDTSSTNRFVKIDITYGTQNSDV